MDASGALAYLRQIQMMKQQRQAAGQQAQVGAAPPIGAIGGGPTGMNYLNMLRGNPATGPGILSSPGMGGAGMPGMPTGGATGGPTALFPSVLPPMPLAPPAGVPSDVFGGMPGQGSPMPPDDMLGGMGAMPGMGMDMMPGGSTDTSNPPGLLDDDGDEPDAYGGTTGSASNGLDSLPGGTGKIPGLLDDGADDYIDGGGLTFGRSLPPNAPQSAPRAGNTGNSFMNSRYLMDWLARR
jgi:hypothetical protein